MSLQNLVHCAFSADSALASSVDEFRPRPGQTEMALAVARTLDQGGVLVVEAGTGIGKTYSYLVPALLSGERVLLSTATKTLQDQLFGRDLPRLIKALGLPVRTALLKGRSNYLCSHRLDMARHELVSPPRSQLLALAKIEAWSQTTRTGDMAELPGLDERSPLMALVTSTRDNCLGSDCPKFKSCHVNQARREALAADVVVVNHHLFFADLAVRESGMAELLPSVRTVIFDEAHQLNETGVQFLGASLGSAQLLDFSRDLLASGLLLARGLVDWHHVAGQIERASRDLRLIFGMTKEQTKLRWISEVPETVAPAQWHDSLSLLGSALALAVKALSELVDAAPDFLRLQERAQSFQGLLDMFSGPCETGSVRWLEVGFQIRLVQSPLDIAQAVQTRLLKSGEAEALAKSWIFTSATLGDDAGLSWFIEPCGLQNAEILKVDSPFDYATQSGIYVPRHLPEPSDPSHSRQVADLVAQAATQIGGRTLVLTTSLRALRAVVASLQQHFAGSVEIEVLGQDLMPKRELMERFRLGNSQGRPGCILVASASFWEGVDIPGEALQLVVIDKLPFPAPNDPLVEARSKRLEQAGRSSFKDYSIPEAAIALKQGAGRLIRRESDLGLLVVCDTRLATKSYGRRLLAALPAMRKISNEEEFGQALTALRRTDSRTTWP
ncbi:MAG: ATP-dependent DNA helicase [Burkholderiaceae bacterium]